MYALFIVYPIFRQFDISFYNWHVFPGVAIPSSAGRTTGPSFTIRSSAPRRSTPCSTSSSPCRCRWSSGSSPPAILTDRLPGRGCGAPSSSSRWSRPGWSSATSSPTSSPTRAASPTRSSRFFAGHQVQHRLAGPDLDRERRDLAASASGRASAGRSSCSWPRSTACRARSSRPAASTAPPSRGSGGAS